jgi:hypothetical protein
MSSVFDQTLDIDSIIAERRLGFRTAARIGFGDFARFAHGAHAATAATGDGLDHHCAAIERLEERQSFVKTGRADCTFDHRYADLNRQSTGSDLIAKQLQCIRRTMASPTVAKTIGVSPCWPSRPQ